MNLLSVVSIAFVVIFALAVAALIVADIFYSISRPAYGVITSPPVWAAIKLSAITSGITVLLVILFAIPMGYALSRYRFVGNVFVDTLVDLPIVLPPLVVGVSLLVFFQTGTGKWIESIGLEFVFTVPGIVLCQFFVSASYGIRAAKAAFDGVDPALEQLAMTLGCSPWKAFRMVALPMARGGLLAGGIMAWARAVGVFGPLMIFAGAVPMKTEVMPTRIYLELSVGRIEAALAVALVMLAMGAVALVVIRLVAGGRRWWGI